MGNNMRLIKFLIFFVIILCSINLALMNGTAQSLYFWPFDKAISLPIYVWFFIAVLMGFLLGWLAHIFSSFKQAQAFKAKKALVEQQAKDAQRLKDEALHIVAKRSEIQELSSNTQKVITHS